MAGFLHPITGLDHVLVMGLEALRFRWRAIALRVAGSWMVAPDC